MVKISIILLLLRIGGIGVTRWQGRHAYYIPGPSDGWHGANARLSEHLHRIKHLPLLCFDNDGSLRHMFLQFIQLRSSCIARPFEPYRPEDTGVVFMLC